MGSSFDFRNEKLRELVEFVELHPKEFTYAELAERFGLTEDTVTSGIRRAKKKYRLEVKSGRGKPTRLSPSKRREEYIPPPPNTETVLVIGDLHEPFTLEGYREFCIETAKRYKVTHVIFIGDVLDNHAISYHEHDPEGMSAGDELHEAKEHLAEWYKAFPKADVILGNHDRLVMRKAFTSGLPREWIMDFQDVFGVPGWTFSERKVYDGVQYIHGEGGTARLRAKKDLMSTVQGHLHPQMYTEYFVGQRYIIFASQIGCGVDRKSYAMVYAKDHPKPSIGALVVLNHGQHAINVPMKL